MAPAAYLCHYPHLVCGILRLVFLSNRARDLKGQRRLGRVTTVVSYDRIFLRSIRLSAARLRAAQLRSELSEKEGIMSFSNPINIATATMEQIYERLCWVYAAIRSTVIFDAIGNSYQLSVITQFLIQSCSTRWLIISRLLSSRISRRKMFYAPGRIGQESVDSTVLV